MSRSTGYVSSSVVQDSCKTNQFKVTIFSNIKLKTLLFTKEANYQFSSLDEIINEFQLMELVNVMLRIVHAGE